MARHSLFFSLLALLLFACSERDTSAPVAEEIDEPTRSFNVATASGKVLPAQRVMMSFEVGGRLVWIASEGSEVEAGDQVARLESAGVDAAVAIAQAGLDAAEAQLLLATSGARTEDITAAEGAVTTAQANVLAAEEMLDQAENSSDLSVQTAQASLDQAQGALEVAQAELDQAEEAFPDSDPRLVAAQAQVSIAEAGVAAAQVSLQRARLTSTHSEAIADAQLQAAQGQLAQAQARKDALVAGPTDNELAALQAQATQAKATLAQAEAVKAQTALLAPFEGTVGAAYFQPGESVLPGQPVLSLGDLTALRVETTDFSEVDASQVTTGTPATLTFDALPGIIVDGRVVRIAPMAAIGQGGTNFTLTIEMDSPPQNLRWGMTAFVDIELE